MIFNYEAAILKELHSLFPELKEMTYASDEDLLTGLDSIKKFPALFYSRDEFNLEFDKPINIDPCKDYPYAFTLYPYIQYYTGTILVENQGTAFKVASTIKMNWHNHCYLNIHVPGISEVFNEKVRVSLTLLSVKIRDVRLANSKIGACRAVVFKWKSNLFVNDKPDTELRLVEEVNIRYRIVSSEDHSSEEHSSSGLEDILIRTVPIDKGVQIQCIEHVNIN